MNRTDLQRLANDRIGDAKALLAAKRWGCAYYVAGYAVECALKACIAKLMKSEEFPDKAFAEKCWTHDLERLVGLARIQDDLTAAVQASQAFVRNWEAVRDWTEASRYRRTSREKAEGLLDAITDKKYGVLTWIKARW